MLSFTLAYMRALNALNLMWEQQRSAGIPVTEVTIVTNGQNATVKMSDPKAVARFQRILLTSFIDFKTS